MSESRTFKAFFSYAHHDADTDPGLIPAFTRALENRVNAKLVNARLSIWRDAEGLRMGDRWSERLERQLRESDVLIVLLAPRWVESEYCRREYTIFEEVEAGRGVGEYIIPILVRSIKAQEVHFTLDQKDIYDRIAARQRRQILATDFFRSSEADRVALIDEIADDIEGMLERLRSLTANRPQEKGSMAGVRKAKEFNYSAQNYERVDFVTEGEIVLDKPKTQGDRDVLAHIGFVERVYVQGARGRIEFGVRRAFVSIEKDGPGDLAKIDDLKASGVKNVYYTRLHNTPGAITVCIDPPIGKPSLTELALPPSNNENFLSKVAVASGDVTAKQLRATLMVSMDVEGLYVVDETPRMTARTAAAIKAIMSAVATKSARTQNQKVDQYGQFWRELTIRERS